MFSVKHSKKEQFPFLNDLYSSLSEITKASVDALRFGIAKEKYSDHEKFSAAFEKLKVDCEYFNNRLMSCIPFDLQR